MVHTQILLNHGADVNAVGHERWTVLHFATRFAGREMVKVCNTFTFLGIGRDSVEYQVLLEHGAKVNVYDNYGQRPFHLAASRRDSKVMKVYAHLLLYSCSLCRM